MPGPPSARRDKYPVSGADGQDVGNALVGGQGVDRHRRRVGDAQPGRDGGKPFDVARHVLRVAATRPRPAVDWRAVLESRIGAGIAHDKASELSAGYVGQRAAPSAATLLDVPRPHPGGQDPDQDLVSARLRHPHLADLHHLGIAEFLDQNGTHIRRLRFS